MNARAITYVEHKDGNEQIEKAKQRLFYLAPDISTAIVRDAITIAAQAARIAELEAHVSELMKTLDLIMEVHPTKNKEQYPFIVRQLVQMNSARALLAKVSQ